MLRLKKTALIVLSYAILVSYQTAAIESKDPIDAKFESKEALGQALFFDTNLSKNRTQSCASCHSPDKGFTDANDNGVNGAVSLGDDGLSLGSRNTPTIAYASLTPAFHKKPSGIYTGGFFLDGRADTLVDQAGGPILNPIEMALKDKNMLLERILENQEYKIAFEHLFDAQSLKDSEQNHKAVSEALAAFENTEQFQPFTSKYDRFLRGEYTFTKDEDVGRLVFFSDLVNCNSCHTLSMTDVSKKELFTSHEYHNIGVPINDKLNKITKPTKVDNGLYDTVADDSLKGKFKVPTLRNIAVTGPYMHNGVFQDLNSVILFYNRYIIANTINPETGKVWREPEVNNNISKDLLSKGHPIDDERARYLLAFLKTLTDEKYEDLIKKD